MTDAEVCGEIKDIDGLQVYCGKSPHAANEMHTAIIDDGESGSTSIGWWTH